MKSKRLSNLIFPCQRQWWGASLKISLLLSIPIFRHYEKGNWRWVMLRWWDRLRLQACYRSYTTSWGCSTFPRQSTLSASKLTDKRSQHWTSISSDTSPGLMIALPQDWAVPAIILFVEQDRCTCHCESRCAVSAILARMQWECVGQAFVLNVDKVERGRP